MQSTPILYQIECDPGSEAPSELCTKAANNSPTELIFRKHVEVYVDVDGNKMERVAFTGATEEKRAIFSQAKLSCTHAKLSF